MRPLPYEMLRSNKINTEITINSGQVFLWKKYDGVWYGLNGQDILKINENADVESYQNKEIDFFRKNDRIEHILKTISKDKTVRFAIEKYPGLRIVRQDPFQCLISFIVSANSNIQKIKTNLERLSEKFGDRVSWNEKEFHLFPEPKAIAKATIEEIKTCGLGYRAKFVHEASKIIQSGELDFEHLKKSDYLEAKYAIQEVTGIGNKVADCILLFSLEKLEAFPLDRWMIRILQKYYMDEFKFETKTITDRQYQLMHEKIIDHFGKYAGYAQQFLFKMERENYQKKWL